MIRATTGQPNPQPLHAPFFLLAQPSVYRSSVLIKVASLIRAHISPLDGTHVLPAAFSGPIVLGTLVQRTQHQAELLSPYPTYSAAVMFWPVQTKQLSHAALPLCHLSPN
jgi:hypothetical protein